MRWELNRSIEIRLENFWKISKCKFVKILIFNRTRAKNVAKRQEFNRNNETEFLQNRQAVKEGKKNPWEKVVENIEIKESDYKGTKDVSRMRTVILNRKGDFTQMEKLMQKSLEMVSLPWPIL